MFVFRFTTGVPWDLKFHWWHRHFSADNMTTSWYWAMYSEWLEITIRWFQILSTVNNLTLIWVLQIQIKLAFGTLLSSTHVLLLFTFWSRRLGSAWYNALECCVYFYGVNVYSNKLLTALYFVGMYPVARQNGLSHAGFANWPGYPYDTITSARHS